MKSGWQKRRLGELCEIIKGKKPKLKPTKSGTDLPYLVAKVMRGKEEAEFACIADRNSVVVEPDETIIICDGSNSGEVFTGFRGILSSTMGKIVLKDEIDGAYLRAFLNSTFEIFNGAKTGAAIPHLDKEALYNLEFSFPAKNDQKRIVQKLDEVFAGIAKAKENAEKNLQNARALFESHLETIYSSRSSGWAKKTFGELVESNVIGLIKNSREQGSDKAWPYLKMNNITPDNRLDLTNVTFVDATQEELRKYSLEDGDFLFNTRNSHELVGKSCVYKSGQKKTVLFNNNIMRVRFKSDIDPDFILLTFSNKDIANDLNNLKSGTTNVSAIYYKDLRSLEIPVPSNAEQKEIVKKLNHFAKQTQLLASLYQQKCEALDVLKKSILHEAFSGNL